MSSVKECSICSLYHSKKDCPDKCECGDYHTSRNHECWICGEKGFDHFIENCSKKCKCEECHSLEEHKCSICNELGHIEEECPNRCMKCEEWHILKEHVCCICKNKSHLEEDCPLIVSIKDEDIGESKILEYSGESDVKRDFVF